MLTVVRRLMAQNVDGLKKKLFPVLLGLADENGYPHQGYIDFANNVVSASTGTITLRGVFSNPPGRVANRRLLRPGMFVRIRLPISQPHQAVLVAEQAVGSDQGRKYLYVVNANNTVEYRPVETGALQEDGLAVIEKGLNAEERVIVSGLQLVRPGQTVKVDEEPMPRSVTRAPARPPQTSAPTTNSEKGSSRSADKPSAAQKRSEK